MVENPVLDFKLKHFSSVHGYEAKRFCGAWNSI